MVDSEFQSRIKIRISRENILLKIIIVKKAKIREIKSVVICCLANKESPRKIPFGEFLTYSRCAEPASVRPWRTNERQANTYDP